VTLSATIPFVDLIKLFSRAGGCALCSNEFSRERTPKHGNQLPSKLTDYTAIGLPCWSAVPITAAGEVGKKQSGHRRSRQRSNERKSLGRRNFRNTHADNSSFVASLATSAMPDCFWPTSRAAVIGTADQQGQADGSVVRQLAGELISMFRRSLSRNSLEHRAHPPARETV